MNKFQKQMLTIAAAGALTAVTALPAMAFENEFHGSFIFNTIFSNYNNGLSGTNFAPQYHKNKMNNYIEQRVRLQYIAKASDDLKLVTQFEIDNQYGKAKVVGTNGTTIDTDTYNVEVKHAYLDFNIGKNFNTKLGMQPYKDTLKGIFIDADIPAAMATAKLGAYTLGVGFSRLKDNYIDGIKVTTPSDHDNDRLGDLDQDLVMVDNTFVFTKDTKAAFSYYLLADYSEKNLRDLTHTFGLSGETKVGPVNLSGFGAIQTGSRHTPQGVKSTKHGWAANVAAKVNVGPGVARTGFLYVSGDNNPSNSHDNGWANTGVQSYNESGLVILTRNTENSPTNTDQYIRRVITNQAVAYLGYDAKLTEKFNLNTGVGLAWVPASDNTGVKDPYISSKNLDVPYNLKNGKRNASDFMGTEVALTAGYQLYKNLKLMAQGAYMFNGNYYKNSALDKPGKDPENPYTMRLQARYSF